MTTLRSALTDTEGGRLEEAVNSEAPSLARLLDLPVAELTAEDLDRLREAVGVLLVRRGFDAEYAPNELGQQCEDLIDRLAPLHWGKGT